MAITQAQIDALIQFIDETETAESVTNVIVAAIVRFLNDKIKHVEETQLTIEDLEEEAGERINADTTIQQNVDTLSNRINALLNNLSNKTDKNSTTGRLEFSQAAPVVLKSMGQGVDGKLVIIGIGDVYYDDNQKIIKKKISATQSISIGDPDQSIIYGNASNDKTYRWNGTKWVTVSGGDLGGEIQAIKNNMQVLLDALSNIAFNGERPEFDWSDSGGGDNPPVVTYYSVTQNLTDVDSSFSQDMIAKGNRLRAILSIKGSLTPSDMYVIDDDSVVVTMNNIDITEDVYTPATGVIDIPKVTGEVVITASAITYVSTGLVFMLDGKHQGSTQGEWTNLANENYPLVLTGDGYTRNSDHIAFDGGSSGSTMANGVVEDFGFANTVAESTSEAVIMPTSAPSNDHHVVFITGRDDGTLIGTSYLNGTNEPCMFSVTNVEGDGSDYNAANTGLLAGTYSANQIISISHYGTSFKLNGENLALANAAKPLLIGGENSSYNMDGRFSVCGFTSRSNAYTFPYSGNIYCIRLYSRVLTPDEVMQNFKVDKKRFNIN